MIRGLRIVAIFFILGIGSLGVWCNVQNKYVHIWFKEVDERFVVYKQKEKQMTFQNDIHDIPHFSGKRNRVTVTVFCLIIFLFFKKV